VTSFAGYFGLAVLTTENQGRGIVRGVDEGATFWFIEGRHWETRLAHTQHTSEGHIRSTFDVIIVMTSAHGVVILKVYSHREEAVFQTGPGHTVCQDYASPNK
jgi:hypothetical protein